MEVLASIYAVTELMEMVTMDSGSIAVGGDPSRDVFRGYEE